MDELFDLPTSFAAAPDIGWPDCFNSGLMLLHPNEGEFRALQAMATAGTSFDGADQGLLNEYYVNKPWHRLSFVYNCTPSASYQYEPAYRHFKNDIKLVHFIGKEKPWTKGRQALHNEPSSVYKELLGRWWAVYDSHYTAIVCSGRVKTVKREHADHQSSNNILHNNTTSRLGSLNNLSLVRSMTVGSHGLLQELLLSSQVSRPTHQHLLLRPLHRHNISKRVKHRSKGNITRNEYISRTSQRLRQHVQLRLRGCNGMPQGKRIRPLEMT